MNTPYRHAPPNEPVPLDPIRVAQAKLLDEITNGLAVLNKRLAKNDFTFSSDYPDGIRALQNLHDSVLASGLQP